MSWTGSTFHSVATIQAFAGYLRNPPIARIERLWKLQSIVPAVPANRTMGKKWGYIPPADHTAGMPQMALDCATTDLFVGRFLLELGTTSALRSACKLILHNQVLGVDLLDCSINLLTNTAESRTQSEHIRKGCTAEFKFLAYTNHAQFVPCRN